MQPGRSHIPLVEVSRGPIVESVHTGSLVISQPDGKILFSAGDSTSPVFLRSAAKPFQTMAFLEQGGAGHYDLEPYEIAIMCASHSGTDEHVRVLENLQAKVGIQESMLQCGIHAPFHIPTAQSKLLKGEAYHSNQHDCAGKHSGMLAFARMLGQTEENYLEPSHPIQRAMLKTFAEMCAIPEGEILLGTDGCSAPVFAVPLPNAAAAFARLCQPDNLAEPRASTCRLITDAMSRHPDLVGGPQRFDTDVMSAAVGSLVTKIGAEGYHGIGVLPGKARGFSTSLGIAIKIGDGDLSLRAGCVVALQVLRHLGVLDEDQLRSLPAYDRRPLTNWRGIEIGEIRPSAELRAALSHFPA